MGLFVRRSGCFVVIVVVGIFRAFGRGSKGESRSRYSCLGFKVRFIRKKIIRGVYW